MVKSYELSEIRFQIHLLEVYCAVNLDSAVRSTNLNGRKALKVCITRVHSSKKLTLCFQTLKKILKNSRRQSLQQLHEVSALIECSLILIQAYVANFRISKSLVAKFWFKPTYDDAKVYFSALMKMLIPERMDMVIATVCKFLKREQLWKVECICSEIFDALLASQAPSEVVLKNILGIIEDMIAAENLEESRHAVRVLYTIIRDEHFASLPASGLENLIKVYHASVEIKDSMLFLIRTGFETVLKRILKTIAVDEVATLLPMLLELTLNSNLSSTACKDFGLTVCEGVARLRAKRIHQNLQKETFELLLDAMSDSCEIKSFMATRFLTLLTDHYGNFEHFSSPIIFYEFTNYEIKVAVKDDTEALALLDTYQEQLESSIFQVIRMHCDKRDNLRSVYSLMCTLIVSVPCGFTITYVTSILLKIQGHLKTEAQELNQIQVNHLHALIASLMTLICWTTRASSLTKYVHKVINLRYDRAAHLNPPLVDSYQFNERQRHFIKPELIFDPWELRYCFWKYFRLNEDLLNDVEQKTARKPSRRFSRHLKESFESYHLSTN